MAKVSRSAVEAKELGLLRGQDKVVFHAHELLHVAKQQARALAESGYRPPLPARHVRVAGDVGIATFRMLLVNRSAEHTSELQSLMRISYAVFCLKKKKQQE